MQTNDYASFLGAWKGLLATADSNGYFRHLTPDWEVVVGWSREELMAKPFVDFVHPDDRDATIAVAASLDVGHPVVRFENRYRCKDGTYKWILWTASIDMSVPAKQRLVHATAHEITEHVETRQQLELALTQAQGFRSVLEATSDFVSLANLDKVVTYINQAGLQMTGHEREDVEGSPIAALHPPDYNELLEREAIPRALEHGVWSGEGELLRTDGSRIQISQVVVPIRDATGRLSAMGTIVRDISRAKILESELRAQKDRLLAALQAMSTPFIPITREIVVMPLIGQMDPERAEQVMEVALDGVQASGAQVVILDVTGLAVVDSHVAAALIKAAQALRLLGTRTILTGIQAAVAQTLVGLGLDLGGISTHSTLQQAVNAALREAMIRRS